MKKLILLLIGFGTLGYGAQAPLPQKQGLPSASLEAFGNLVNESKESKTQEVMEIHTELNTLYQQAKNQTISLADLGSKLIALISKLTSEKYKNKKFDSLYGYISLADYAALINDAVLTDIGRIISLAPTPIPLPKLRLMPKILPKKQGLSPIGLETFGNLVNTLKGNPEVQEIYKEFDALYQQTKAQNIFLTDLKIKLESLISRLNSPIYKDKKFQSATYGDINLQEYASILEGTLIPDLAATISLFGISQQTINYFKDIINAIQAGKNAPAEVNLIKTQLSLLLGRVLEKNISMTDLLDQLKAIALTAESPKYATIKFISDIYGPITLKQFSEIILRSLIDHITNKVGTLKFTPVAATPTKPVTTPAPSKQPVKLSPVAKPAAPIAQPAAAPRQPTPPPPARNNPLGLNNLGNSCFMNASLQNLVALDDLSDALLKRFNTDYYPQNSFADEYVNFINAMRSSSSNTLEPRAVCMRGWQRMGFAPLSQQDNDEFISFLFVDLFKDTDPIRKLLEIKLQTFLDGKPSLPDPGSNPKAAELLLSVPANKETLDANVKEFFAVEKGVEYGYPPKPTDKQEKIVSTSKYLIIHLKRNVAKIDPATKQPMFDNDDRMIMEKITTPISFPTQNLDLNAYAIQGTKLPLYRLKGIVIHTGSARGGHYYGYVRYGNQWYEVNDSQVNQAPQQRIEQIAQQGYGFDYNNRPDKGHTPTTLFYERI